MRALLYLLTVVLASLAACSRVEPASHASDLRRNLELAPGVEVFAPEGVLLERCQRVASWGLGYDVHVLSSGTTGDARRARIVLGTPQTAGLSQLIKRVGAQATQGGFRFEGLLYSNPADALIFTLEDPSRPGLPLTVFLGNDEASLARYVVDLTPSVVPGVRSFEGGRLILESKTNLSGQLQRDSLRNHKSDYSQFVRGTMQVRLLDSGFSISGSAAIESTRFDAYCESVERSARRMREWFGAGPTLETTSVWLHTQVESFSAAHGEPRQALLNRVSGEVNVLFEEGVPHDSGSTAALAIALRFGGPAHAEWLEHGASLDAADAWWERDLSTWVAHLVRANGPLSVEVLVDPNAASMHSPHRVRPLQAMLCRYLRELHGAEGLREVWGGDREFSPSTQDFAAWLTKLTQGTEALPSRVAAMSFLQGVCLLASEEAPHGSDAEAASLAEFAELGGNAVSLVCYTALLPELSESVSLCRQPGIKSRAGDVALSATLAEARRLGLRVLLTPHALSAPSGSWAGEQVRSSQTMWEDYFERRSTRVVDHFALLGELCEVELLSLGSELSKTSRTKRVKSYSGEPGGAALKRAGWQRNLKTAREGFRGGLLYTAEGPEEMRQVEFWNELDYVGCSLYGAFFKGLDDWLSPPGDEQMVQATKARVLAMLEVAEAVGKPLIVTEWGMPSTSLAWRDPRAAAGEVDLDLQARAIAAVGRGLALVSRERAPDPQAAGFSGAFLWNWWTDSQAGGEADAGFTPQNKPAQKVLQSVFAER